MRRKVNYYIEIRYFGKAKHQFKSLITEVDNKFGLKTGDTILSIGNEVVNNYKNLSEIISDYKPGDEVVLKVLRDKKEMELKLKLGSK